MPTTIDRIQKFINWLDEMTDFGVWDQSIKDEVHKKLITLMISNPSEKEE